MRINVTEICNIPERAMALYKYPFSVNIKELGNQQNLKNMKLRFIVDWHFLIGCSNKGYRKLCPIIP